MTALPIAGPADVRRAVLRLIRADGRTFAVLLAVNSLSACAGLAGPWLLGRIIDKVRAGSGTGAVDRLALVIVACALVQLLLTRYARYIGFRFGERVLARVREQFVDRALALPASVVERAGAGDLTARGTGDVTSIASSLNDVGPTMLVSAVQCLFLFGAVFVIDPVLGGIGLLGLIGIRYALRWYLRRARDAYLAEGATNSEVAGILAATAAGARTVEAFGLREQRLAASGDAIEESRRKRFATLALRSVFFPAVEISYLVPVAGVLVVGALLHAHGAVSVGAVAAAALYLRQVAEPLDQILMYFDQLQASSASFARIEGLATAPRASSAASPVPDGDLIEVSGVRYAYDDGAGPQVLHGIDLTVRPGERLAVVGPSGAGKSTLSRLLAGIDAPVSGSVTVGGVPVCDLGPEQLRRHVVLVTQEHHVFLGTLRDNLLIAAPSATDPELLAALATVGADWATDLDSSPSLDGSQSQQLALARVVLADPHTLILDEATALLDPRTARHTERALVSVLAGRTVIAIAHRLHTAHDADRVAVMEGGRLTELGTHDALVAAGGAYAALWHSWHGDPTG
jgi:ATP-binding cassette subfamily C protein